MNARSRIHARLLAAALGALFAAPGLAGEVRVQGQTLTGEVVDVDPSGVAIETIYGMGYRWLSE